MSFVSRFYLTAAVCAIFCGVNVYATESLARGLGEEIDWKTLDDGFIEASQQNKPLMLIIHKTWCGACKKFRPMFAESKEIKELSQQFVMVNLEDNDEPSDAKYRPDGGYVPRVLFFDQSGDLLTDVYNSEGNSNYKYFYPRISSLISSMNKALEVFPTVKNVEL